MANNKKPQYKIGDKVYFKALSHIGECEIIEIYSNKEKVCYLTKVYLGTKYGDLFQPLQEEDIYKKISINNQ